MLRFFLKNPFVLYGVTGLAFVAATHIAYIFDDSWYGWAFSLSLAANVTAFPAYAVHELSYNHYPQVSRALLLVMELGAHILVCLALNTIYRTVHWRFWGWRRAAVPLPAPRGS